MEIWKDIPGYEGLYQISDKGNIFIVNRNKLLKGCYDRDSYKLTALSKNNKKKTFKVHRLVMLAFVGPSPLQVNHINGIKTDNRLENLEYCTHKENMQHASKMGLARNYKKINEEAVFKILDLLEENKLTQKQIGEKFNITFQQVSLIKLGKTWKKITQNKEMI